MSSPYHDAHVKPDGPGDARPTAMQIIKDNNLEGALSDKVILITGCSSGIGIETAHALSTTNARLFLTTRSMAKGQSACAPFLSPRCTLLQVDLASLSSVQSLAAAFLSQSPRLDILICNGAIMGSPVRELTADGFEAQFGTNYLSHFLLFNLLKPALLKGAEMSGTPSRVVSVSSSGHKGSGIVWDDIQLARDGAYGGFKAYGQSKTAQIYMANYIDRVWGGAKGQIHALSVMPGGIESGLQKHLDEAFKKKWDTDENRSLMKSAEQGAATTVLAAVGREWEGKGGVYLEDCEEAERGKEGRNVVSAGVAGHAFDVEAEDRLWGVGEGLIGLKRE